jgi:hypothetical protein
MTGSRRTYHLFLSCKFRPQRQTCRSDAKLCISFESMPVSASAWR